MKINKWELIKVGLKRPEWKNAQEGLSAEWTDEKGLSLFFFCREPSEKEREAMFSNSRFEIAFKDVNGIGFFAVKFGQQPWVDCPFSPSLYIKKPEFPEFEDDETFQLHILLVDTTEGELKLFRTINAEKSFAENFRNWALEAVQKESEISEYSKAIEETYSKYPTSELLAQDADFRWIFAHGEDERLREVLQKE